jgi:hypothetical protein
MEVNMEFEELTVRELRDSARHFAPESRGKDGIAHTGNKDQLIALLREKGIMPIEAKEYCMGRNVEPPVDPVMPFITSIDAEPETSGVASAQNQAEPDIFSIEPQVSEPVSEPVADPEDELEIIRRIINRKQQNSGVDREAVEKIVKEQLDVFRKKQVKVIEVKQQNGLPNKVVGVCHKLTQQIAEVANLGIHQMLVGPAGGGKTTCCEKVAEILNLEFLPMSVGPQTTKSDLLGFIDAAGNYHTTPLREAFEKGGLLLLDEVDAANAGVLTIINSLLANGYCSFPDGVIKRNENFRCICACNTYGRGADRQYVGRNQLDAATLDRFAVVDFDYDEELERAIACNDEWVDKIIRYRKRAFDLKMRVVISPRASIYGAKLLASGMKEKLVEELVVWKGVSKEIRTKISEF